MKSELTRLLHDLGEVYSQSDIKDYCSGNGHEWYYSLVSSTLEKGGPLILGFNWGAAGDESYKPQTDIDKTNFLSEDIGSLSRIIPYCKQYFGDDFLSKITQSNYCFFRSKKESQISKRDMDLCEPIFEKLLFILEPSLILCFSSKLRDFLCYNNRLYFIEAKDIKYVRNNVLVTYTAMKASFKSGAEVRFLPHPNYPIKGDARSEAWEFCCGRG